MAFILCINSNNEQEVKWYNHLIFIVIIFFFIYTSNSEDKCTAKDFVPNIPKTLHLYLKDFYISKIFHEILIQNEQSLWKNLVKPEVYLSFYKESIKLRFCKISYRLKLVELFLKKTPSKIFDSVLNTSFMPVHKDRK